MARSAEVGISSVEGQPLNLAITQEWRILTSILCTAQCICHHNAVESSIAQLLFMSGSFSLMGGIRFTEVGI